MSPRKAGTYQEICDEIVQNLVRNFDGERRLARPLGVPMWSNAISSAILSQQERIEQGLKSGELSTKEAGQLEREQDRVDQIEARDLKDGSISAA